jgi:hypothetical protein
MIFFADYEILFRYHDKKKGGRMRLAADAAPPSAVDARKARFVPLSVGAGRENFQMDEESDNENKSIC